MKPQWLPAILLAGFSMLVSHPVRSEEAKVNVAVLDFSANNVSAGEASVVTEFVRAAMVRSGKYPVVDRNNMSRILQEQAFQQTGCTSEDCAVKLGKVLNVHKVVVGEYSVLENTKFLTAKLVDVETGRIEGTGRVKGFTVATADEAADRLVAQITGVAVAPVYEPGMKKPEIPIYDRVRFSFGWGASYGVIRATSDFTDAPGGPFPGAVRTRDEVRLGGVMRVGVKVPLGGPWGMGGDIAGGIVPKMGNAGGALSAVSPSTGNVVNITPKMNTSMCLEADVVGTYRLGRFVFFAGGGIAVSGLRIEAQGQTISPTRADSWSAYPPDANLTSWLGLAGVEILIGRDWSLDLGLREDVAGSAATKLGNVAASDSGTLGPGTTVETAERTYRPWLFGNLRINF